MKFLRKKSSILTLATLCLLVLIISGGFFTMYLTENISTDAETINKLGIIRGSTQRLAKLELYGVDNKELEKDIQNIINELNKNKKKLYDRNGEIYTSIENLNTIWNTFKEDINNYRLSPSVENKSKLIIKSEETWEELDNIVLISQLSSEIKVKKYRTSLMILGLDVIFALLIIFLIRKHVRGTLEYLVDHDVLTNIYNKRYFNECIEREIIKARKYNNNLSLMILDIDYFKNINDSYGHDIGDVVLREMSEVVKNNIRKNDIFFRVGGEEFAIISPNTDLETAFELDENIRKAMEQHEFNYLEKAITISIGVSRYTDGDDSILLFKKADLALYEAKHNGRNRVC